MLMSGHNLHHQIRDDIGPLRFVVVLPYAWSVRCEVGRLKEGP